MRLALLSIAILLVATIASAAACADFHCDSSCCVRELVLHKVQVPAILPGIAKAPDNISILPVAEHTAIIFESIVPTARTPLRI